MKLVPGCTVQFPQVLSLNYEHLGKNCLAVQCFRAILWLNICIFYVVVLTFKLCFSHVLGNLAKASSCKVFLPVLQHSVH